MIAACSLALLLALALLVRYGLAVELDLWAARAAAQLRLPGLRTVGRLLTLVGNAEPTLLLPMLLSAVLWWRGRRFWACAVVLIVVLVAVEILFKELLYVPRWELAGVLETDRDRLPSAIGRLLAMPNDATYPSGHVARAVFLGGLLVWAVATGRRAAERAHRPRPYRVLIYAATVLILALMAITRLTERQHTLSDVVGGVLLAGAFLPLAWRLIEADRAERVDERLSLTRTGTGPP